MDMWKTIKYSKTGNPLIDVNEQGVFYSYQRKNLLSLHKNRSAHPYLCFSTKTSTKYAHIEVAKAFPEICGEWFDGCEVHHKDGNSLNNEASNLVVCSKEEHKIFHQLLKEQERLKKLSQKTFDEKFAEIDTGHKYTVHYYCRESKKNKKSGLSPIEENFYQKGKRVTRYTGFYCSPEDFRNGKYPKGFNEYVSPLNNKQNAA